MYNIALAWDRDLRILNATRIQAVTVVGCGGTGSFVAEGLARLLPSSEDLILIDMDTVEERNLTRQCFTADDIGQLKSETLAKRLADRYQRPIKYSTLPVGATKLPPGLIIGCLDNGLARKAIADNIQDGQWWIDAGNGRDYGQVLIGNSEIIKKMRPSFAGSICFRLPLPSIQQPAILTQVPEQRSCNEAVVNDEQSPTINQAMATLLLEVIRRIIQGTCPWAQLHLDLEAGTLTPTLATPELVSRLTGITVKSLVARLK